MPRPMTPLNPGVDEREMATVLRFARLIIASMIYVVRANREGDSVYADVDDAIRQADDLVKGTE